MLFRASTRALQNRKSAIQPSETCQCRDLMIYEWGNELIPDLGSLQSIRMSSTTTNVAVYKFNHTMFRIKDPKVSIPFYEKVLGMEVN